MSPDDTLRTTRAEVLETRGYRVVAIASEEDALALLEQKKFDLVVVGHQMSGVGIDICERIREQHPDLLILSIRTYNDRAAPFASRSVPPDPHQLLQTVKEMLNE